MNKITKTSLLNINYNNLSSPIKQNSHAIWKMKLAEVVSSKHRLWLFMFTILLMTLILYWRRPDAFVNPQLWAEDGEVFFTDTYFGGLSNLFIEYRDIYHVLGRLAAFPGKWVPLPYIPHYYYFMSWLMLVALTGFIFSNRLPFSLTTKFLLSLFLVANAADFEVFFNIANWATISSFWWILLALAIPPATISGKIFDVTMLVLNGLNAAFTVVLWPLFLFRWVITRRRYHAFLAVISPILVIAQVWNMRGRVPPGTAMPYIGPILADVLITRFGFIFVGELIYQISITDPIRIVGSILLCLSFGALLWHGLQNQNWEMVIVLSGGILCFALSIYVKRLDPALMLRWSGRHFYIPAVTMAWGLLLWEPRRKIQKWIPLLLIAMTFLFFTPKHKNVTFPDLDWAGKIAACTGTQPRCKIPTPPVWDPLRWFASIDSHIISEPEFSVPFRANFDDQIELRGYSIEQTSDELLVELIWFVSETPQDVYTQFVHLVDAHGEGRIWVQSDTLPQQGMYLTDVWTAGEYIVEPVTLPLTSLPLDEYTLFIGWYDASSTDLMRLPAFTQDGQRWEHDRAQLPSPVTIDP